jgi:hypothetical protein
MQTFYSRTMPIKRACFTPLQLWQPLPKFELIDDAALLFCTSLLHPSSFHCCGAVQPCCLAGFLLACHAHGPAQCPVPIDLVLSSSQLPVEPFQPVHAHQLTCDCFFNICLQRNTQSSIIHGQMALTVTMASTKMTHRLTMNTGNFWLSISFRG